MPLVNITGVSNINSTFNVAFCLVNGEDGPAYQWLLERLNDIRVAIGAAEPGVVITDFEKALKSSISIISPKVQQHICVWHINKNICYEVKKRWIWPDVNDGVEEGNEADEGHVDPIFQSLMAGIASEEPIRVDQPYEKIPTTPAGFIMIWKATIYARTKDNFEGAWQLIMEKSPDQGPSISYILDIYLVFRKQFVECFNNKYRNFGIRVTSRTERSHKETKSYLHNSTADVKFLADRIEQMIKDKESKHKSDLNDQNTRQLAEFSINDPMKAWMGDTRNHCSRKALTLIRDQHRLVHARLRKQIADVPCTNQFTTQYGLLCSHKVFDTLSRNEIFSFLQCHPHWHLQWDLLENDEL